VLGLNGVDLAIYGPDGVALPADYADSGLLVITATGPLNLLFTDFSGSGADYSIGMGIAGGGAGFLAMMDPDGVAVSTPVIATCSSSPEALEATMTVPGTGQQIAFRFETGTEPNTVSFLGSREAVGQIRSMTPVPTGLVVSGTIVVGPDAMLGFPFWLGVYGCEATA
jgi:hypothetical protein